MKIARCYRTTEWRLAASQTAKKFRLLASGLPPHQLPEGLSGCAFCEVNEEMPERYTRTGNCRCPVFRYCGVGSHWSWSITRDPTDARAVYELAREVVKAMREK
jgi:hypothetical protein